MVSVLIVIPVTMVTMVIVISVCVGSEIAGRFLNGFNGSIDAVGDFTPFLTAFCAMHMCVVCVKPLFGGFQVGGDRFFRFGTQFRFFRELTQSLDDIAYVMQLLMGRVVVGAANDIPHFFQLRKCFPEGCWFAMVAMIVVAMRVVATGNRLTVI